MEKERPTWIKNEYNDKKEWGTKSRSKRTK